MKFGLKFQLLGAYPPKIYPFESSTIMTDGP